MDHARRPQCFGPKTISDEYYWTGRRGWPATVAEGRNRDARLFLASLYPQNQKVPLSCTFTKRPKSTGTQGTMKPPFSFV